MLMLELIILLVGLVTKLNSYFKKRKLKRAYNNNNNNMVHISF